MSAPRGRSRGGGRGGGRSAPQIKSSSDNESTKTGTRKPRPGASTVLPKPNQAKNGLRAEANVKGKIVSNKRGASAGNQQWRTTEKAGSGEYKERMHELWQQLKVSREKERKDAIRNGFLADPDKPTRLKDAITPVGTCQEMCPEYERVERVVQLMVDGCEKTTVSGSNTKVPCEAFMVKRFRRSAAGYDEQLPSDIRPPLVLQKTLNYLIDEVVGGPEPLAKVHKFVWDRTRGIRNDFSIQQVSKKEDLRIAIDCFERIARFHLLSLHQLSHPDRDNGEFDHHQEREQLNNTLLSLMYYYEDSRQMLTSPNEAEFRAYCIIFEIQDQRPDLEDRAQMWPKSLLLNPRVQTALRIYATAMDTTNEHGPLRPRTTFSIAQACCGRFWSTVGSKHVSYLMACAAEIYFNLIRGNALEAIRMSWKGAGRRANKEDLVLDDLKSMLGFDTADQAQHYCEEHGFSTAERKDDGLISIDLTTVRGKELTDSNPRRKQVFSKTLVEKKRRGRTFRDIINGLTFSHCRNEGLLLDDDSCTEVSEEPSLFVPSSEDETSEKENDVSKPELANAFANSAVATHNPFVQNTAQPNLFAKAISHAGPSLFQAPSNASGTASSSILGQSTMSPMQGKATSPFIFGQPGSTGSIVSNDPFKQATNITPSIIPSTNAASSPFKLPPASNIESANKLFGPPSAQTQNIGFGQDAQVSPFTSTSAGFSFPQSASAPSQLDGVSASKISGIAPAQINKHSPSTSASQSGPSIFGKPAPKTTAAPPLFTFNTPPISNTPSGSTFPSAFSTLSAPDTKQDQKQDTSYFSATSAAKAPASALQLGTSENGVGSTPPTIAANLGFPSSTSLFQSNSAPITTSTTTFTPLTTTTTAQSNTKDSTPFLSQLSGNTNSLSTQSTLPAFAALQQPSNPLFQAHSTVSSQTLTSLTASAPAGSLAGSPPQHSQSTPQITISEPPSIKHPLSHKTNSASPFSSPTSSSAFLSSSAANKFPTSREAKIQIGIRSEALDKLTTEVVCGEYGLLEMIIQHIAAPIIHKSERKVARERERERVATARSFLLGTKYFRRWRDNAWKLNLTRRGNERRKKLAESVRSFAESARNSRSTSVVSSQEATELNPLASLLAAPNYSSMPPPKSPPKQRAINGPPKLTNGEERSRALTLQSRDLMSSGLRMSGQKHQISHHRRSQTLGGSINATQSGRISKLHASVNGTRRFIGANELMSSSLIEKARLLVSGRTDKTRTDYFRLKAMRVDPDTPVIPQGRKRIRDSESSDHKSSKSPRLSPPESSPSSQRQSLTKSSVNNSSTNTPTPRFDADEEELFAQVRQVREAMAEDEAWFKEERERQEKRRGGSNNGPDRPETEKERRLREFRFTPSRTSVRLRQTNARGLLPEGYWADGPNREKARRDEDSGSGQSSGSGSMGNDPRAPRAPRAPRPSAPAAGFAAFATGGGGAFRPALTASTNGFGSGFAGTGSSADDAIEL